MQVIKDIVKGALVLFLGLCIITIVYLTATWFKLLLVFLGLSYMVGNIVNSEY